MLNDFKKITFNDIDYIRPFLGTENEYSCETTVINLVVWKEMYDNSYLIKDGCLFMRSHFDGVYRYSLPFSNDMERAVSLLSEIIGERPVFWAQEGDRFERFNSLFSDKYDITYDRDAFDYIYLRENLSSLAGKKYHAKRNHISSFSKRFDWKYERITSANINDVKICADKWYKENSDRFNDTMRCEKAGISIIFDNIDALNAVGGAIRVGDDIIAFTIGSAINKNYFDIHIEKALADYAEGYTVINKEFALNELSDFKYINREDDLGLEGLRKAKLSYKPDILLQKYNCVPKGNLL